MIPGGVEIFLLEAGKLRDFNPELRAVNVCFVQTFEVWTGSEPANQHTKNTRRKTLKSIQETKDPYKSARRRERLRGPCGWACPPSAPPRTLGAASRTPPLTRPRPRIVLPRTHENKTRYFAPTWVRKTWVPPARLAS